MDRPVVRRPGLQTRRPGTRKIKSMTTTAALTTIYVLGVVVGLLRVDGSLMTKVGVALVWPVGLLVFVLTIMMLVAVAAVAFPMFGIALVGAIVAAWVLM